jgi:hypothetical protein
MVDVSEFAYALPVQMAVALKRHDGKVPLSARQMPREAKSPT